MRGSGKLLIFLLLVCVASLPTENGASNTLSTENNNTPMKDSKSVKNNPSQSEAQATAQGAEINGSPGESLKGETKEASPTSAAQVLAGTEDSLSANRIVLLSVSMGAGQEYCDLTEENHNNYANAHGYKYVRLHESDRGQYGGGDPKWAKMRLVEKYLDKSHSWVVWIDCDMVITNPEIKFEDIISRYRQSSTDLIIARDSYYIKWSHARINSGIFLLRDNDWSKDFVHAVISKGVVKNEMNLVDQPRICLELEERNELDAVPKSVEERHKHTSIIPQRVMNSFLRTNVEDPPNARWEQGDFIAHVCGMSNKDRKVVIKDLLSKLSSGKATKLMQGVVTEPGKLSSSILPQSHLDDSKSALTDSAALFDTIESLDRIENNIRKMLIKALLAGDMATVQELTQRDQQDPLKADIGEQKAQVASQASPNSGTQEGTQAPTPALGPSIKA